jgi:toxin ParE1/3/4
VSLVVRVHPAAEADIEQAAAWYEAQRIGLGVRFLAELDRTMNRIAADPETGTPWSSERPYRRMTLRRFPYIVVFERSGPEVLVLAVAHTRRSPGFWLGRAP